MQNDWLEYIETRRELRQRTPRVLLGASGVLRFNPRALELLGNPKAVRLLFDVQKSRIGIGAEDPAIKYALPLRRDKKSSVIHIASFCSRYGIQIESTIEFVDVRVDGDGVMLLDLRAARRLAAR